MRLVPFRRPPRKLKTKKYQQGWQDLQKYCATRKTWPQAVIAADDLLSDALKQKRYKGKTTGERLVAAQHDLTANDLAWFGHKLRDKIVDQDVRTLKKQDILEALAGFRQALRDLGAIDK